MVVDFAHQQITPMKSFYTMQTSIMFRIKEDSHWWVSENVLQFVLETAHR